jgi:hypothetical protein
MLDTKATIVTLLAGLAVLAGCSDDTPSPVAPEATHSQVESEEHSLLAVDKGVFPDGRVQSIDDEFARLAREIPGGFGGWFLDAGGNLNIYLTNPTQRAAAVSALMPTFRSRRFSVGGKRDQLDPANIKIQQGQYDFAQLKHWRG